MPLEPDKIIKLIEEKQYIEAEKAIVEILAMMGEMPGNATVKLELAREDATDEEIEQAQHAYLIKMTVAIADLFCTPNYQPSQEAIATFTSSKRAVDWIFDTGLWGNTDILIEELGIIAQADDGSLQIDETRITHLLMLVSSGSKFQLPWAEIMAICPSETLTTYIGLLNHPFPALTQNTDAGFNFLLEVAATLPIIDLNDINAIKRLVFPYFICSYATSPNKYEFKQWLNAILQHNVIRNLPEKQHKAITRIQSKSLQPKKKYKMVILLETYPGHSAMFRIYNKHMTALAKQYDVVAFISTAEKEHANLDCFDRVVAIDGNGSVNHIAQLILNEKPDIIYYPSIGMRFWTIPLSLLRLAPIQLMTGGHPASSFSSEMDYFLVPGSTLPRKELQQNLTEKLIMLDDAANNDIFHTMEPSIDQAFLDKHNQFIERDDEIVIGINGVLTKVSYDVINMCHQIQERSDKKVTFILFSLYKKEQIGFLASKNQLSRFLDNFEVISFSNYPTYLKTIARCDFLLPTLPFGGSNSNIDAMLLNKPKLFIKGKAQLYTLTDHYEWNRVGLGDLFGFDTIEEMTDKAVELVENQALRRSYHQELIAHECVAKTFDTPISEGEDIMVQLVEETLNQYFQTH